MKNMKYEPSLISVLCLKKNIEKYWKDLWHSRTEYVVIYINETSYTEQNYKHNTLVFAPIFHELNTKI